MMCCCQFYPEGTTDILVGHIPTGSSAVSFLVVGSAYALIYPTPTHKLRVFVDRVDVITIACSDDKFRADIAGYFRGYMSAKRDQKLQCRVYCGPQRSRRVHKSTAGEGDELKAPC
jgi:hypothetical protein